MTERGALRRALRETVRGKRRRADAAWLLFREESVVDELHWRLRAGCWQPSGFSLHRVKDPKPRCIAVAPIEDRVVHTALVRAVEPAWMPGCPPEDIGCRDGGGVHRALLRLQAAQRRHSFAMHLDVRSYFPSVRPEVLVSLLAPRVDPAWLSTLGAVLDVGRGLYDRPEVRGWIKADPDWPPPGRGLPIGAFTSQFCAAHVYLRAFDHFVKRRLRVPAYLRYVDDLFVFGDSRTQLRSWRDEIGRWLAGERDLRLKDPEARWSSTRAALVGLGHVIGREEIRPLRRAWRGLHCRVRRYVAGDPRASLPAIDGGATYLRRR